MRWMRSCPRSAAFQKARREWTRDKFVDAYCEFHDRHGRWPRQRDLGSAGLPSYRTVRRAFGNMAAAQDAALAWRRELAQMRAVACTGERQSGGRPARGSSAGQKPDCMKIPVNEGVENGSGTVSDARPSAQATPDQHRRADRLQHAARIAAAKSDKGWRAPRVRRRLADAAALRRGQEPPVRGVARNVDRALEKAARPLLARELADLANVSESTTRRRLAALLDSGEAIAEPIPGATGRERRYRAPA
jgi:hypothetical protein